MATPDIIFYAWKTSPYSLRVELAFQEAKADVTRYSINPRNKPEWFASRVNPAGKVPALLYGSPKSDPEHPSAESAKIAESLVILEFIADLYPDSGLLPKDPVERARVYAPSSTHSPTRRTRSPSRSSTAAATRRPSCAHSSRRSRSCSNCCCRTTHSSQSGTTSPSRMRCSRRPLASGTSSPATTSARFRWGPARVCTRKCSRVSALRVRRNTMRTSRAARATRIALMRNAYWKC